MVIKKLITIILLITPTCFSLIDKAQSLPHHPDHEWVPNDHTLYLNTHFLTDYDLVKQTLIHHEHFNETTITTQDDITLNVLYRLQEQASASIILSAGFFPGRKEGLATFITMIPSQYNIIFFDARGHGDSGGSFLGALHQYGLYEYKDILAVIAWAHQQTKKPILLYGLCAGAFNTIKAAIHLVHHDMFDRYAIKGIIFDSGIPSIPHATKIPVLHIKEKVLPKFWLQWYTADTKETVKYRLLYRISWFLASLIAYPAQWYLKKQLEKHEKYLTLDDAISTIPCPILFIHARNDHYSPFASIAKLIACAQKPSQCILDETEHAVLHLKHNADYCLAFNSFIKQLSLTNKQVS